MYLVEDKILVDERAAEPRRAARPSDRWESFPYSRLSHHASPCCDLAREWVLANDFAQLNGADLASGPRWLRQKYKWGPSKWPMHWCEVVGLETIDCGAHSALAHEVFAARGLTSFPAQLVQRYSTDATDEWRGSWEAAQSSCHWLDGEHIYHEATGLLVTGDKLQIWDGSAGTWVNPRQGKGYGSVAAVRIFANGSLAQHCELQWGEQRIQPNSWNQIAA
jgi:hypothetical protein